MERPGGVENGFSEPCRARYRFERRGLYLTYPTVNAAWVPAGAGREAVRCPVCDGSLVLSSMDVEPWSPRTMGERRRFRCTNCGMTQSEWSAIEVPAPSTVPD
jgi:hypothetical protein